MRHYTTTMHTPIGPFTLVCDGESISAAGFTSRVEDLRLPDRDLAAVKRVPDLAEHSRAVAAYFDGDVSAIDGLPVTQPGSAFHLAAWHLLRQNPVGHAHQLSRAGNPPGASGRLTRGGDGLWPERRGPHRAVPSRAADRWWIGWFCLGRGAQAMAARS